MALSKDRGLKTNILFFYYFSRGKKFPFDNMGKNPMGIFKIPTGNYFSYGIFKIPMGFLSLSSYLKPI